MMLKRFYNLFANIFYTTRCRLLFEKYKDYTMIPQMVFLENLKLIRQFKAINGAVVECGVWRGGMSASMAEILGSERDYFLFDSFEGLPPAQDVDGANAIAWQANTTSNTYYENCSAEKKWAQGAMTKSGIKSSYLIQGWFSDTLPKFNQAGQIAVLRLDGDWYQSTMECLVNLYPKVVSGGVIILDDYFLWDGCSKAVHDYLSKNELSVRIRQFNNGNLYYIIK